MTKAQKALEDLINWSGPSEIDSYPYVRDLFADFFNYPKDHIRLADKSSQGRIPDLSLVSADAKPKDGVYWVVGEVKRERGAFRSADYRREVWETQLKDYVSADTVYALLIDPDTIVVLRPDGDEIKSIELDLHNADELLSPSTDCSLAMLHYDNSVCEASLIAFKEGYSPSRYLDVTNEKIRAQFYEALRISARELIDYSVERLQQHRQQYDQYVAQIGELKDKVGTVKDEAANLARKNLDEKYEEVITLFERDLKKFETQIGRQLPQKEDEARRFLENLYATEGSSLVLARILFIRFLEDHDMTSRKISNGGIKAFRDYHRHIKDNYQYLLTDAFREAEQLYRRLFEPSVFDWSHKGNGQLSRLLLRVFYRLNAFDFIKITGDILGNLYERILEVGKRKRLGEYYTPMYVAKYVIERIGFYDDPAPLLDPACGSGTFLIAAADGLIEHLLERGVKVDVAIRQAIELIHGLDINMFAAFIAQLQMIWHLLPYLKQADTTELPELKIFGGINSLVHSGTLLGNSLLTFSGLPKGAPMKVRDSKYRYVVGNPPYIRNERLKDKGPWRANYDFVDFKNSDIAYFFVARAIEGKRDQAGVVMPPWLEDNGRMCFVLPMGMCDSDAASIVRKTILQNKILEVTDLEEVAINIFPSPQTSGRATVVPILLFAQRAAAEASHMTRVVQVAKDAALKGRFDKEWLTASEVPQSLFQPNEVNTFGQILTKLRDEDLPILKILLAHRRLEEFSQSPTPCYGIEVRGGRIYTESQKGLLPIGKGQNVHTFYLSQHATKYVNINTIPNNSIWGHRDLISRRNAFALSNISLTLQCTRFDPSKFSLDSAAMLFAPKECLGFPWECLLNSSPLRFVHLLTLRVGLIERGKFHTACHIYPRILKSLPVPESLLTNPEELSALSDELNSLGNSIARRWVTVDETVEKSTKPLALFGLDFSNWQSDVEERTEYRLTKEQAVWTLRPFSEEKQATLLSLQGTYQLLNVIKYVLETRDEEGLTAKALQTLKVPENFETASDLIDTAVNPESEDIKSFRKLFSKADSIIAKAYGLNKTQLEYLQNRLKNPPLDVLEPRWPWKGVEMREIKEYETDRFA